MVKSAKVGIKQAAETNDDDLDLELRGEDDTPEIRDDEDTGLLDLDEYQRRTKETALYPGNDRTANNVVALSYAALGFAGEAGEIAEEVLRNAAGEYHEDRFIKELGDDYWYAARLAWHLRVNLSDCVSAAYEAESDKIGLIGDENYYALRLVSYTGKAADLAKKVVRDNLDLMDPNSTKRGDMVVLIGAAVICLQRLGGVRDIPSKIVTDRNLEKLAARREAGTLHGSGSER